MNLIWVTIRGFKRFEKPAKMNVDGKAIAIVGPNESGKSSFLKALYRLNDSAPFAGSGGSQELTRGVSIPPDQQVVELEFLLEQSDKEALAGVTGANKVRWVSIAKKAQGGAFPVSLQPKPERDLSFRREAKEVLRGLPADFWGPDQDGVQQSLRDQIVALVESLDSESQSLAKEVIEQIRHIATLVEDNDRPIPTHAIPALLNNLAAHEEQEHPEAIARQILFDRRPRFLLFGDEERSLQPEYALDSLGENPPAALQNLARLAGLSLRALSNAIAEKDFGKAEALEEEANAQLKKTFLEDWSQTGVTVRLRVDNAVLHVLVGESHSGYVSIAERSDGLRQFVALLAFVSLEHTERIPVLLVDEAESHFHYDAQADLIQMFTKQKVVSKIIYTTHSIGCLPEDLGSGVRLVEALTDGTSTVRNWFWDSDTPGFSPLLFGMGATTMAFVPIRFALVTEGASDMILLPTLLREATGRSYLGFQVVPGLSSSSVDQVALLEHGAPRTAYLLDSDSGGDELRAKLMQAGVPEGRIFRLPGTANQKLVIEDLIDPETYLSALNQEFTRSHGPDIAFSQDLPETNRPKAVKDWCESLGISPPNKRAVAYRILELRRERALLSSKHRESLNRLYLDISSTLQVVADRASEPIRAFLSRP